MGFSAFSPPPDLEREADGRPRKASALAMTFVTSDFLNWTEFPVAEGLA
jgi:hypothetical protein